MVTLLQQYIISIIEQQNLNFEISIFEKKIQTFLGVVQENGSSFNYYFYNFLYKNHVYIIPDVLIYFSIIILILYISYFLKTLNLNILFFNLKKISSFCLNTVLYILVLQWIFMVYNNTSFWITGFYYFNENFIVNIYTHTLKILTVFVILILFKFLNVFFIKKHYFFINEFILLIHIWLCLVFILISSNHFGILLIGLEGFSLILYILTTIDRTQGGITASMKYFVFGTLGSIFLFWGLVHFYMIIPTLNYKCIFFLLDYTNSNIFFENFFKYNLDHAISLIFIGFIIKLGAAPFHIWVPDVYTGSHTIITAFFSTIVKFILFLFFIKFFYYFNNNIILNIIIILSLTIGTFLTLRQMEIKRFIAYSSITHLGFLFMADLSASFIYILTYIISLLLFFCIFLNIKLFGYELIYMNDLRYIKKTGHLNNVFLITSLLSMAGIPPLNGFYGKLLIWESLIEDIYLTNNIWNYIIFILSIVLSLLIIYYYVRFIIYIYMTSDSENILGTEKFIWFLQIIKKDNINILDINFAQLLLFLFIIFWTFIQPYVLAFSILLYI